MTSMSHARNPEPGLGSFPESPQIGRLNRNRTASVCYAIPQVTTVQDCASRALSVWTSFALVCNVRPIGRVQGVLGPNCNHNSLYRVYLYIYIYVLHGTWTPKKSYRNPSRGETCGLAQIDFN